MKLAVGWLAAALLVATGCSTEKQLADRAAGTERHQTSRWKEIAESPLVARHGSVGVWTGAEMLVVGGTTARGV